LAAVKFASVLVQIQSGVSAVHSMLDGRQLQASDHSHQHCLHSAAENPADDGAAPETGLQLSPTHVQEFTDSLTDDMLMARTGENGT